MCFKGEKFMKKNNKTNIIFAMLIIIFVLYICSVVKIKHLKHENSSLKETCEEYITEIKEIELVPCYLCDGEVKIQPVNDSFYIECENCELRTDFFKSKSELIRYWNKE